MPKQCLVHYWQITKANKFDVVGGKDFTIVENVTLGTDRLDEDNSALNFISGFKKMPSWVYLGTGGFTISFCIKIDSNFAEKALIPG